MSVLIVVESAFGNTLTVAQAVAAGITETAAPAAVRVVRPGEAPGEIPAEVRLLVVGAPTHEYSLPKTQTRRQAVHLGATEVEDTGLREWIERVTPRPDLRVATFDTSVRSRFSFGSAAKAAAKALAKRGFSRTERGPSFYVTGTTGPLADGEERRAADWGRQLAGSLHATEEG
jgi:flavodoxin